MFDELRRHARAVASLAPAKILRLSGRLHSADQPVTAIYAGNESNLDFISTSLFASEPERLLVREVSPVFIARTLSQLQEPVDIVVAERPPLWATLGGQIGQIRMPAWVRQELRLTLQGSTRWTLGRHLEREVQRQIRRHEYRLVLSTDAADRDDFFEDFYLPYIRSRHGSGAITVTRRKFQDVAATATLAKLFSGDAWTAGMLLLRSSDSVRFGWFGARSDPPAPGASEVLDALCINYAIQQGIHAINLGNSRPSMVDGIVRYKRKFGAEFVLPRYPQTVIEWQLCNNRSVLRDWLIGRQFLCMDDGALTPANSQHRGLAFEPMKSRP